VVTVKNVGTGDLRVSSVSLDDSTGRFTILGNECSNVVLTPGGNTCKVTVQFNTTTFGQTFNAKLQVIDDQPGSPHVVPLSGSRSLFFCRVCVNVNPLFPG
jgi:hypothetical protein